MGFMRWKREWLEEVWGNEFNIWLECIKDIVVLGLGNKKVVNIIDIIGIFGKRESKFGKGWRR